MMNVKRVDSDTTLPRYSASDSIYFVDTSDDDVTITLPASEADNTGWVVTVIHETAGNTLTIDVDDSGTISNLGSLTSTAQSNWAELVSDGTQWVIISQDGWEQVAA